MINIKNIMKKPKKKLFNPQCSYIKIFKLHHKNNFLFIIIDYIFQKHFKMPKTINLIKFSFN